MANNLKPNTLNAVFTQEDLMQQLDFFLSKEKPNGYETGVSNIDDLLKFETGRLYTITGVPQSGKSEIVDFINVQLNKLHGWKTLYFSPENYPTGVYHLQKLLCKYRNEKVKIEDMKNQKYEHDITYISNNFYFLNYDLVKDIDTILNEAGSLISKENIKVITIDPFNRLEHQYVGQNETQYISLFLDKLTGFAQKYDILVNLIAHPTKQKEGEKITGYSICGSQHFFAKADFMYAVKRDFYSQTIEFETLKVKFKNLGSIGKCYLKYDFESGNYSNAAHPLDFIYDEPGSQNEDDSDKKAVDFLREKFAAGTNKNVLDVEVSHYKNIYAKECTEVNLYDYLKNPIEKINLESIRSKPDFKTKYKPNLPCITPSGLFYGNHSTDKLKKHSGLMVIDIDKKDQILEINVIFERLKSMNNIAYLGKSCSGEGLFGIMPISQPDKHREHFLSIEKDLKAMDIVIDSCCKDITRLRLYSYDKEAYYNEKATPYTTIFIKPDKKNNYDNAKIDINDRKLNQVIKDIQESQINIADSYNDWLKVGAALCNELEEEGRAIFHIVSSQSKKYDYVETDEMYYTLSNHEYDDVKIGSFYYLYEEAKKKEEQKKVS